jgi:ApaG protein
VRVQYLPDRSNPPEGPFAFAYTVTIRNTGDCTAQLVARQWLVTHAHGRTEEVRGLAVVGHQPVLKPGEVFEYTSWTKLATPQGSMRGTFFCMTEDARPFEAPVEAFDLVSPGSLH